MLKNEETEKLIAIIKKNLSPKRFNHSLGVMECAQALSKTYGQDPDKALIAGLLHDATKEYDYERHIEFINKYDIIIDDGEKKAKKLLHAITSAAFAEFIIGIKDEDILNAIRYHTTGRANMSTLEKIIYISDFIEPNRSYADVEFFRRIAFEDLDKTMYLGIKWSMEKLIRKDSYLHVNTLNGYNHYINSYNKDLKEDFYG